MEETDIHVYFEMTVEVIAVITALVGLVAWLNRKITKRIADVAADLDAKTKNIQSGHRNGGSSLTDLSHELRDLRRSNDSIHDLLGAKVDGVSLRLRDHIDFHDQRRRNAGPPAGTAERRQQPQGDQQG